MIIYASQSSLQAQLSRRVGTFWRGLVASARCFFEELLHRERVLTTSAHPRRGTSSSTNLVDHSVHSSKLIECNQSVKRRRKAGEKKVKNLRILVISQSSYGIRMQSLIVHISLERRSILSRNRWYSLSAFLQDVQC